MKYYSLNHNSKPCSFADAVKKGLAPDRGLYFPEKIPILPKKFFNEIQDQSIPEMAFKVIKPFIGKQINNNKLLEIVKETLDFKFPVVEITKNIAALELFQGPTLAFKDVGARFMARTLGYLKKGSKEKITVMVATSGDTGGAVANGFLGVEGVDVVILYPKGKVSEIQELQLTTLGNNVSAIEVDGYFDKCQEMVKKTFVDKDLNEKLLTSANSINIARWIPQMLYYFIAYKNLKRKDSNLVVSVPSGNFGNLCAGMLAKKMGLPIDHFIASTNENDTIPKFMKTGKYKKQKTISTITNAMDVGDPSNFVRILKIYNNNFKSLKKELTAYKFSDEETILGIKELFRKSKYLLDPHGATAYLGLKK